MRKRSWSISDLKVATKGSSSLRQVLTKLGLIEAGGNYAQIRKYIAEYSLDTSHFKGKAWSRGMTLGVRPQIPTVDILVEGSDFQSYKLKKRLFAEGLKLPKCELCGWNRKAEDGRLPLELDHINGDKMDNRFENLRILCPNCHSLQPTHRGRNIGKKPGWRNGRRQTLKMS